MHAYTNTTALVTGASKGLGEAYARELASRGAHLVLVARSADTLHALADEIRTTHSVRVDVIAAASRTGRRRSGSSIPSTDSVWTWISWSTTPGWGPWGPSSAAPSRPTSSPST
ncbi:SDR family NAD(P)-dependent oxidoreductase [Streptomyces sp. NPDC021139]|uniref:SDR family NAD(P)-dependent oxidoreductase n=1 Tax=unclassified Streptomyces TaxID=2593676 RepID=UPI00340C432F